VCALGAWRTQGADTWVRPYGLAHGLRRWHRLSSLCPDFLVPKLRLGTPLAAKLQLRLTRAEVKEVKKLELFPPLGGPKQELGNQKKPPSPNPFMVVWRGSVPASMLGGHVGPPHWKSGGTGVSPVPWGSRISSLH
jgi:hypothetical protein